jgi:hypothetical protein
MAESDSSWPQKDESWRKTTARVSGFLKQKRIWSNDHILFVFMVRPARFERAAYGFEVRRSIQLSYGRITELSIAQFRVIGYSLLVKTEFIEFFQPQKGLMQIQAAST